MNKTYSVPSIHCQHCVYTIKMELSELEGENKEYYEHEFLNPFNKKENQD